MDRNETNLLIDYYGDLLTSHQVEVLKMYYCEDFSMQEISETLEISKAAVSDLIKRSTKQLVTYEDRLKFIEHDQKINAVLDEMDRQPECRDYADRIRTILKG